MRTTTLDELAAFLRPPGWPRPSGEARGRIQALACFAIAAQVLFVLGWLVAGALESGYSPTRDYVSELGRHGAANPWIFDLSVVIWGAGFIALATALWMVLRTQRWGWAMPTLFAFAGLCAALDAPLRLDCASTLSHLCKVHEAAGTLSWRHYGHQWASLGVQSALALTPFALAWVAWPAPLARLALGAGLAIVLLRVGAYLLHDDLAHDFGLEQRLFLLVVHGWVIVCAATLILEVHASGDDAKTT